MRDRCQNDGQFMSKKKNNRGNSMSNLWVACNYHFKTSSISCPGGGAPPDPPAPGWEDLSKNALGWEDLSKNVFFKLGLKTYIIKRLRSRASIWCRFHRKWCKLWWFTSVQEKNFQKRIFQTRPQNLYDQAAQVESFNFIPISSTMVQVMMVYERPENWLNLASCLL